MRHLLALSLGPVQEFIAAARRTADLQAGSTLLVAVARAAAGAIAAAEGRLIFPADAATDGPNKLLAELEGIDPSEVAEAAKTAARDELGRRWEAARERLSGAARACLDEELAARQVAQFLECYAAWWPLGEDYREARAQVERLLAGRRALRDFEASPAAAGRPKSPLDPARDGVLRGDRALETPEACWGSPLWLKRRETLDAISLLKRASGDGGVPSTSLMAARALLPRARARDAEAVAALQRIADDTRGAVDLGDLLFAERVEAAELGGSGVDPADVRRLRRRALEAAGVREAVPYFALLVADGDRMGKVISAQQSREEHQRLSWAVADFARRARERVAEHDGHCVYAGGDDVLAMLPIHRSIPCAAALAREFQEALAPFVPEGDQGGTLSVGVALVHHLEPLQFSLERARAAEKAAKGRRDALAVALHTRGGEALTTTLGWQGETKAEEEWRRWTAAFRRGLARGLPYELRALAREWKGTGLVPERLRGEAERILRRKEGSEGHELPAWVRSPDGLERFVVLLTIARFLAPHWEVEG